MATEVWKIENTICRCCHSEGSFHNLAEPRPYLGDKESYSEMLRECFNIVVTPMPGDLCSLTYSICNSCVGKLREASSFKKQVQVAEERFMELYYKNAIKVAKRGSDKLIKEEPETIDFKEEFLEPGDDDEDFKIPDDMDNSSEEDMDLSTLSAKGKGKGKRKVDTPPQKFKVKSTKVTIKQEKEDKEKKVAEQKKDNDSEIFTITIDPDGSKRFSCTICERYFKRRDLMMQHYRHVHLKLRPKLRSCHLCDVKVPGHMRAMHMEEHGLKAPTCNACGKKFYYPFQVIRHQKSYHMGERNFECEVCHMRFAGQGALNRHSAIHSSKKPFKCEFCPKAFKWKKNLKTHIDMHLDIRQHACQLCDKAFVQSSSLNYHMAKHHPDSI